MNLSTCPDCEGGCQMVAPSGCVSACENCGGTGCVCPECGLAIDQGQDLCEDCETEAALSGEPPCPTA